MHAQDVALAPLGAVRSNEYYVSQYLDLTPDRGRRARDGGRRPAEHARSDAVAAGRLPRGRPPLGHRRHPADRSRPARGRAVAGPRPPTCPGPGCRASTAWRRCRPSRWCWHRAVDLDDRLLRALPGRPPGRHGGRRCAARRGGAGGSGAPRRPVLSGVGRGPHRPRTTGRSSATADPFAGPDPDRRGAGPAGRTRPDRGRARRLGPAQLLHPRRRARRHRGQAGPGAATARPSPPVRDDGCVPDEPSVCATVWMDGAFCSQLTQGHVSLGAILSVRRSYLGLDPGARAAAVRAAESPSDGLAPARHPLGLAGRRWTSAGGGTRYGRTAARGEHPRAGRGGRGRRRGGGARRPGRRAAGRRPRAVARPRRRTGLRDHRGGRRSDRAAGRQRHGRDVPRAARSGWSWTPDSGPVADDGPLFRDGRSRGSAVGHAADRTADATGGSPCTPQLVDGRRPRPSRTSGPGPPVRSPSSRPDTAAGRELDRIGTALPWFAHDALIHYLSPRGLEQYTGGAWGTRDVSQGPVGAAAHPRRARGAARAWC